MTENNWDEPTTGCALPPPLDEVQLWHYVDGEADEATREHIRRCRHCQQRAGRLEQMQQRLKTTLHRRSCPSSAALRDYHFDLLDVSQAAAITHHLIACPHCTRELLEDYGGEARPSPAAGRGPGPVERLRLLIATLLEPSTGPAPAFALRDQTAAGAAPLQQRTYRAGSVTLNLAIHAIDDDARTILLEGDVSGDIDLAAHDYQLHLWHDDQVIEVAGLDVVGDFSFRLPAAEYTLILSGPEQKVYFPALDAGQSGESGA